MTARRKALTVAGSSFALVALAGCQKPTPAVTLVADGERVRSESTVSSAGETVTPGAAD